MIENAMLELCKNCTFNIICNEDPTVMCNAYKVLMRLRGESFKED